MDDKDSLPPYIEMRPPHFDPHKIIVYLDHYDKKLINAEIDYDEAKDQKEEMFDFVISEKVSNESISVAQAKVKANNDKRYKKLKLELSKRKAYYLLCKVQSKNAHSYCENLKQKSINELATEKLTRN